MNFIIRIQNNLLRRERSSNKFNHFEGDLRRECYDEVCSYSEAMEAIEHVPSMIAFWGIHKVSIARIKKLRTMRITKLISLILLFKNPCDTFNLCDESKCDNLGNGKFQCRCADGRKGDLCDINCNQKYSGMNSDQTTVCEKTQVNF